MTFKMSHDRYLRWLAYAPKMFIYSLFQCLLCFAHIRSLVTFAANECIDNIPITATWIFSCLVFGVSCRTPYLFSVHIRSMCCLSVSMPYLSYHGPGYQPGSCPVYMPQFEVFGTLLSSCQTYVTQAGVSELS